MNFPVILHVLIFILLLLLLAKISADVWSLSKKVFVGLLIGTVFGVVLHLLYGINNQIVHDSLSWFNIVGNGYVKLLQMIIIPLVFASILNAVARLHQTSSLGKISFLTIGILLFATAIAALIGIIITYWFGLTAEGLVQTSSETIQLGIIENNYIHKVSDFTIPQLILSFISKNPFADLAGANPTSIISVVIFSTFLVIAALQLAKTNPEKGEKILSAIDIFQSWIMKLVRLVIRLTPYGVMAVMIKVVANSNLQDIIKLGSFVIASYLELSLMFIVHAILLSFSGINPIKFFKKVVPLLIFAFTSRSSAGSIALNVETQTQQLGIPESIANFSASFGTTIGQNGCAGIYPAMLAVMVAPTVGINPLDPIWIATLIGIVTISSAGLAGVGGGATFGLV